MYVFIRSAIEDDREQSAVPGALSSKYLLFKTNELSFRIQQYENAAVTSFGRAGAPSVG